MAKDAEITKTIGASAATILSGTSVVPKVFGEIFNWGVKESDSITTWAGGLFSGGSEGPEFLGGGGYDPNEAGA
jgi:hypothetical protein